MRTREFPELPMVGVGGVVIDGERVLLVRRGTEPARGEWSIPGGLLEVGETLAEGVVRELREETGLTVRVLELIEALDRIFMDSQEDQRARDGLRPRPRYHYVILDYLCEVLTGQPTISEEITDLAFVREDELEGYHLAPATTRVLRKAFSMVRAR
jgi:8-oxo-dGTP diphosphatase